MLTHQRALEDFKCGNIGIDLFLRNQAAFHQSDGLGVTKLLVFGNKLIGFFTSKAADVKVAPEEARGIGDVLIVPALEIQFLAVHEPYQQRGFGKIIMQEIMNLGADMAAMTGCRYIFLRAVNIPERIKWYERREFKRTSIETDPEDNSVPMRYLIPQPYFYDWESDFK